MFRTFLRLLVVVVHAACGASSLQPQAAATEAESTGPADVAGAASIHANASPTASRDVQPTAEWSGGTLSACSPEGLGLRQERSIRVAAAQNGVGGCLLKGVAQPPFHPHGPQGSRGSNVQVFTTLEQLRSAVQCPAQRAPEVNLQEATYVAIYQTMRSSDYHSVAFAVAEDDGTVHVGIQRKRKCQGVAPTQQHSALVLGVPGPGRQVILHRCAPSFPHCGPVP